MNVIDVKNALVSELFQNEKIKGIAQTGDMNTELVPGNSDIDMFVLCTRIPTVVERESLYIRYSKE
jgi:hypothetical protein